MFLALREIKHGKSRFALIIIAIVLISYLAYFLTSLAYGLASSYTNGIDAWDATSIVLNQDSNDNPLASFITSDDYEAVTTSGEKAELGLSGDILKDASGTKKNVFVFAIDPNSFLASKLGISSELASQKFVMDSSLSALDFSTSTPATLLSLNLSVTPSSTFLTKATFETAPIVYMPLVAWQEARYSGAPTSFVSAVVIKGETQSLPTSLKAYSFSSFASILPGYAAQVATFSTMIGFLIVIASFVLGIFIYVLTLQKTSLFGVMKAEGVPSSYLAFYVIEETLFLDFLGIAIGLVLTLLSGLFLAGKMPFASNWLFYAGISLGFLLFSILGALFSVKVVLRIDPLKAIG